MDANSFAPVTPGLNARDALSPSSLAFDRKRSALPSQLVELVLTTSAGVTGSLHRLEDAGLVLRQVGEDRRTNPYRLLAKGSALWDGVRPTAFDSGSPT